MTIPDLYYKAFVLSQWLEVPYRQVLEMRVIEFELFWFLRETMA